MTTLHPYQQFVTDAAGNIMVGAAVEVINEDTNLLADLFSDRAGTIPISNPTASDSSGFVSFFVVGGAYQLIFTKGVATTVLNFVGIGTASEFDDTAFQTHSTNLTTWGSIAPSTDVQAFVSAANNAAMRTSLGVTIGVNVQAWSTNLDGWSAIATSTKQDHTTNLDGWSAIATTIKADLASPVFTGNPTTPNQASLTNNLRIANTAYVDSAVAVLAAIVSGALVFKGAWDASAGTFPGGGVAQTGWFYKVSVTGTVNGILFTVGDDIYALTNNASTTVYAGNWLKIEGSLTFNEVITALGYTPLSPANNLSDLVNAGTARGNLGSTTVGDALFITTSAGAARTTLGLGNAATQNTGTSGANVPLLNGANTWAALQTFSAGIAITGGIAATAQIWSGSISSALQTLTGATDSFRSSAANVTQFAGENTSASSSTAGAFIGMYSNDAAAMAFGDRLGGIRVGGSSSAAALRNSAVIAGFADQVWIDGSAYGSRWEFQTVTNDTASASTKLILGNTGVLSFGTTASNTVPALKPSSTTLQVRLGDDTGFAPFAAGTGLFSGNVQIEIVGNDTGLIFDESTVKVFSLTRSGNSARVEGYAGVKLSYHATTGVGTGTVGLELVDAGDVNVLNNLTAAKFITGGDYLIGTQATGPRFAALGDSLTVGCCVAAHPYTYYISYPTWNGDAFTVSNLGVNGRTLIEMMRLTYSNLNPLFANESGQNVVTIWAGVNDLIFGHTVQETYSRLKALGTRLRQLGWKVIVCTMTSSTSLDADKNIYNGYIRRDWALFADQLADLAANANIGADGAYANPTYFSDGLHMTDAGYMIVAGIVQAALTVIVSMQPNALSPFGPVGIGTSAPGEKLTVSLNSLNSLPAAPSSTIVRFANADGSSTRLLLDAWGTGANGAVTGRAARGTSVSPTASQADDTLLGFTAYGYGATAYGSAARAQVLLRAAENWTDAAQGTYIAFSTTAKLGTTTAERMRINDAGNVGIGTIAPTHHIEEWTSDSAGNSATSGYWGYRVSADASASGLFTLKARGTTPGAETPPLANDALMSLSAGGFANSTYNTSKAIIQMKAAENWGNTAMGTYIAFGTTPKLGTSRVERMRIDDAGNVGIGATSLSAKFTVVGEVSTSSGSITIDDDRAFAWGAFSEYITGSSTGHYLRFFTNSAEVVRIDASGNVGIGVTTLTAQLHTTGSVRMANFGAGAATFDASGNISSVSDERLKNIVSSFDVGLSQLKKLKPILYRWNEISGMETEHVYAGFSAQNVCDAIPCAVGQNSEGLLSLQDRAIMAVLVNGTNELATRVAALESKLALT